MSVNDLQSKWRKEDGAHIRAYASDGIDAGDVQEAYAAGCDNCVDDLQNTAKSAWKPVSEPPVEADGADATPVGAIAVKTSDGCIAMPVEWSAVANGECPSVVAWARIRDVVLLPPEDTGREA